MTILGMALDLGHLVTLLVGAVAGGLVVHNNYKTTSKILATVQNAATTVVSAAKKI